MSKEAKYKFYQEVMVHSDEAEIDGKTGVILAIGCDEEGEWGYTVMIEEYCWDCPESELTSTGRQFKREDFYDDNVSIKVNQKGEIVERDDDDKG